MKLYRRTQRLLVRPLELHDYENWQQAFSSLRPSQNQWDETNWKASELTLAKFKKLLATQKKPREADKAYDFAVFRSDDGVLVGDLRVMEVVRGPHQNAYLGYRILNNFWRQGFATEACQAVIDISFRELKLHRLQAGIEPSNKASLLFAKQMGFRREGLSERRIFLDDSWRDLVLFALTTEDLQRKYRFPRK